MIKFIKMINEIATTEYFLTDALVSVRQLTDTAGEITLSKTYNPYGENVTSAGDAQTSYGFTGEYTDSTGNIYLRARYYNPNDGRFLSRDTWAGDVNNPLSLNRWMYVEGNPVNLTDPSGNRPRPPQNYCVWDPSDNVPYVETFAKIPKSDWLNTYAVAGVAVQCWAEFIYNEEPYDGEGPAQITDKENETPYGQRIPNPKDPDNEKENRGYGLLCYIVTKFDEKLMENVYCTICKSKEEMDEVYGIGNYQPETFQDQSDKAWAIELMRRRIKLVTDRCIAADCSSTDIYIAAALAQNGPGFTVFNLEDGLLKKYNRINERGMTVNWDDWFKTNSCRNASKQLRRFKDATDALTTWYMPRDINFDTIDTLKWTKYCP